MSEGPMDFAVVVVPENRPGAYYEVEVDAAVLDERHDATLSDRDQRGFGYGRPGFGSFFGRLTVPGSNVAFGVGVFGVGAELRTLTTRTPIAAGDRQVRVRAVDAIGNVGPWSAAVTLRHRPSPAPPTPASPPVSGVSLSWTGP